MGNNNDLDKQLIDIDKKIELLKNKNSNLIQKNQNRINKDERKARTARLIKIGALTEKYFDVYGVSADDAEELLKIFSSYVIAKKPDKFKSKKERTDKI